MSHFTNDDQPFVFLSYSRTDSQAAKRLVKDLKSANIDVWWDREELKSGVTWKQVAKEKIQSCSAFVLCLSRARLENVRAGINFEINVAIEEKGNRAPESPFVHVVRFEDCEAPPDFEQVHQVDLIPPEPWDDRSHELIEALSDLVRERGSEPEEKSEELWRLTEPSRLCICAAATARIDTDLYQRPMTGAGQLKGMAFVMQSLSRHYPGMNRGDDLVFLSDERPNGRHQGDLVLLGSRKTNQLTGRALDALNNVFAGNKRSSIKRVDTEIFYHDAGIEDCRIVVEPRDGTPVVGTPEVSASREVVVDYGLVIRAPNPLALDSHKSGGTVCILAGGHTQGTVGAAKWFTQCHDPASEPAGQNQALVALVEFEVVGVDVPESYTVLYQAHIDTGDFDWGLATAAATGSRFELVEQCGPIGKTGRADSCEDAIALSEDFAAVIDGATNSSSRKWQGNETGGMLASRVIKHTIEEQLDPGMVAGQAIAKLNNALEEQYRKQGCLEELEGNPLERASASVVILSRNRRQIWMVGDCQCLIVTRGGKCRRITNEKRVDEVNASARSLYLASEMARGATEASLVERDTGREFIAPFLDRQRDFQNRNFADPALQEFSYWVIDGTNIPEEEIRIVDLPRNGTQVVLASDGYPKLFPSLEATECFRRRILEEDPLMMKGEYKSTKGIREGNESYDDRTFLKIAIAGE